MNKRKSIISRMMMLSVRKTYPTACRFLSFLSSLLPFPTFAFISQHKAEASKFCSERLKLFLLFPPSNAPLTTTLVCFLNCETEIKSRILFRSFLTSPFFLLLLFSRQNITMPTSPTPHLYVRSFASHSRAPGPFKKLNTINFMTFTFFLSSHSS